MNGSASAARSATENTHITVAPAATDPREQPSEQQSKNGRNSQPSNTEHHGHISSGLTQKGIPAVDKRAVGPVQFKPAPASAANFFLAP